MIENIDVPVMNMLPNALNCCRIGVHIAKKNLPEDFDGMVLRECLEHRP